VSRLIHCLQGHGTASIVTHNSLSTWMCPTAQAKPTHGDIIRLAPPLVITEEQLLECVGIFRDALEAFQK